MEAGGEGVGGDRDGDGDGAKPPTLLLGEGEVDVSSLPKVMAMLDAIFGQAPNGSLAAQEHDAAASTKAVQNLIERHVAPGDALLLFTASDVKLEARVLAQLQAQRSVVHAHVNDEMMSRVAREGAKVGDVTITLTWDDRTDLDLHVFTPSGGEISYQNKQADGGYLDVDMNTSGQSTEPVENVFFGDEERGIEAMRGRYRVVVENYAYHGFSSHAVKFKVRVRKNGEVANYTGETPANTTSNSSRVTVVEFAYEGRTAPRLAEGVSALEASNLVAVTTSVGSTLDALRNLMSFDADAAELERVRQLVEEELDLDEPEPSSLTQEDGDDDDGIGDLPALPGDVDEVGDAVMEESRGAVLPAGRQPLRASRVRFEVTSRDRLYLQLARLPQRFHQEAAGAFGGGTLLELTANQLAQRLLESDIPVTQLRQNGYPEHLVQMVKRLMATQGASAK